MNTAIELLYFDGCPNVEEARANLREVLAQGAGDLTLTEVDLLAEGTPHRFRSFPSPTVLVDGRDVQGGGGDGAGMSCRASGAPTAAQILGAIGAPPGEPG